MWNAASDFRYEASSSSSEKQHLLALLVNDTLAVHEALQGPMAAARTAYESAQQAASDTFDPIIRTLRGLQGACSNVNYNVDALKLALL